MGRDLESDSCRDYFFAIGEVHERRVVAKAFDMAHQEVAVAKRVEVLAEFPSFSTDLNTAGIGQFRRTMISDFSPRPRISAELGRFEIR